MAPVLIEDEFDVVARDNDPNDELTALAPEPPKGGFGVRTSQGGEAWASTRPSGVIPALLLSERAMRRWLDSSATARLWST